jgi:signal transduction histidine kinase
MAAVGNIERAGAGAPQTQRRAGLPESETIMPEKVPAASGLPSFRWMPTWSKAIKIAAWYFSVSCLWIFFSGWLLHHLVHDPGLAALLENVKGWFFVGVTALLLGWVLHHDYRAMHLATERLREEQDRLRLISDNLPDSYVFQYVRDPRGRPSFTYVSAGVEKVNGVKSAEVMRDPECLFEQIHPAQRPAYATAEAASAAALKDFRMELTVHLPDGQRRLIRVYSRPARTPDGSVRWDGFVTDVTASHEQAEARRKAEESLRELNRTLDQRVQERTAELCASNEELDAFAYAVSHDLRAPLRAMSGFSRALAEDFGPQLPAAAHEYLSHIQTGSREMGELIDGLLRLSRSTRGILERTAVDLSALAANILEEHQQAEPGHRVTCTIEPRLIADGDARLLEVALRNLLSNSWKYTSRSPQPIIRVHGHTDATSTTISVSDNGAGFDMQHAGKLFQPFQRLHREEEFPGLGIGLATVQRIIRRHGGTIAGTGNPGAGASFTFTLPK